jgi:hypothetical protein
VPVHQYIDEWTKGTLQLMHMIPTFRRQAASSQSAYGNGIYEPLGAVARLPKRGAIDQRQGSKS